MVIALAPFDVIPEMLKALSGIFAGVAGRLRISASAFRGDNNRRIIRIPHYDRIIPEAPPFCHGFAGTALAKPLMSRLRIAALLAACTYGNSETEGH
jgi:hypothetical protein